MREPPVIRFLPDQRRLHLHDGPIDLIIEAFGKPSEIETAYRAAARRFITVLDELCEELQLLRSEARADGPMPKGQVARRMAKAVAPFAREAFITPMAAVAGSVAEEILDAMMQAASLSRAYVNDGGDIAIHLSAGEFIRIGMVERPDRPSLLGMVLLRAGDGIHGVATSGWRGRSFSLGIADAVTVLADRAAMADAAATMIANAVDLPRHRAITRIPARDIAPDNDLGARLVTRGVGELTERDIDTALHSGAAAAEKYVAEGLVSAAAICLQKKTRIVGTRDANPQLIMAGAEDSARSVGVAGS